MPGPYPPGDRFQPLRTKDKADADQDNGNDGLEGDVERKLRGSAGVERSVFIGGVAASDTEGNVSWMVVVGGGYGGSLRMGKEGGAEDKEGAGEERHGWVIRSRCEIDRHCVGIIAA